MYKDFYNELFNLPLPKGLTEEQQFAYQDAIDETAAPLEEKALSAFQAALRLALEYQAYNEGSSKSAAEISKLDTTTYPITGQEGVVVEHNRTNFSQPKPVTSLDVVKERVKARKAAAKPAEPAAPAAEPKAEEGSGEQASR